MHEKESEKPAHMRHQAFLATLEPKHRISDAAVHNSRVDLWGLQKCREFLNNPTITDRTIASMPMLSRLKILIMTHPYTCASHRIGPLPVDDKGNTHILVILEVGRIIPHQDYGCVRGCRVHLPALGSIRNTR